MIKTTKITVLLLLVVFSTSVLGEECPKCKKNFQDSYQFCPFDGEKIWKRCPSCKKAMNPQWKYCPFEGVSLSPSSTIKNNHKKNPEYKHTNKTTIPDKPTKTSLTKKDQKTPIGTQTTKKQNPQEDLDDLPAVDLVKRFVETLLVNDSDTASLLIDWDEYYTNFLLRVKKTSPNERSSKEWQQARDAFKKKAMALLFSKESRKIFQFLKTRHYTLKMGSNKIQVIVSSKAGTRYSKIVFTLKKLDNRFKITFIGN